MTDARGSGMRAGRVATKRWGLRVVCHLGRKSNATKVRGAA